MNVRLPGGAAPAAEASFAFRAGHDMETERLEGEALGISYKLNEPQVTAKVMDGEAVIIHLGSGIYYSMDGVGCAVWESITSGSDTDAIADSLAARYGMDRQVAAADIGRLVSELVAQELVVPADGAPGQTVALNGAPAGYAAPTLQRYDDMADLLALDPPLPAAPR